MVPDDLINGPAYSFATWPDTPVPKGPPGVYTIWKGSEFLYVGISWREPSSNASTKGLWGRLDSHASGRRSGDQFCIYICDRFVIPKLTATNLEALAAGSRMLDRLTKEYIRSQLSFRFATTLTGAEARSVEALMRGGAALDVGRPLLNPTGSGPTTSLATEANE